MIRSAICDDESVMLEQMYDIVHKTFDENNFPCELFCFHSGKEMLEIHKEHPFDIIFLDILMPDRNGFDVAKDVRTISDKTLLLFVTSQDELVYDSFNYRPFYFLRKGDSNTFAQSLSDAVKKIADFIKRNQMISLKLNSGESLLLSVREIAVSIDFTDFKLTIAVKNKIQSSILNSNPHLQTTKGNKSDHGHGIPTIKEIAKKYNGDVDFYESNGWFNASVILYPK